MTLQSPLQVFATVYPDNVGMIKTGETKTSDSNAQKEKEAKIFLDEDFEKYEIGDSMEEWTDGDRATVSTTATKSDASYNKVFQAKAEKATSKTTRVYTKKFKP